MSLDTWAGSADLSHDAWLWRVMQKEKNKEMIARLEDTLQSFVQDADQTLLPFPPRSAFHRRVCYAVARRYGLAHRLEEHRDPERPGANPGETVCLVLIKTPQSATPEGRLAQFADGPPPPERPSAPAPPAPPASNSAIAAPSATPDEIVTRPATFLRRPRTADGKATRAPLTAGPAAVASSSGTALKSISEEDYQRARARIFKPTASGLNGAGQNEVPVVANDFGRVLKVGVLAKGPVEGSTGFERRRNRRNVAQSQLGDKISRRGAGGEKSDDTSRNNARVSQPARPNREARAGQDQVQRGNYGGATGGANGYAPTQANVTQRQPVYTAEQNRNDLQDPDFDRRYDKWAVRQPTPAPAPQQIHVPIFSQLLYPYAVQQGPPLHPGNVHMRAVGGGQVQQNGAGQYPSMMHHGPTGGVVFTHVGQGAGGVGTEYGGVGVGVGEHGGFGVTGSDGIGAGRSQGFGHLPNQSIPGQVGHQSGPAYGLDSTVDFPPLP